MLVELLLNDKNMILLQFFIQYQIITDSSELAATLISLSAANEL